MSTKRKNMATVVITPDPEDPTKTIEIIADEIAAVAKLGRQLNESRLGRRALILLLQDATKVSQQNIKKILDELPNLDNYLRY